MTIPDLDISKYDSFDSELPDRSPRIGFIAREPLDTMLKLERLPPPILDVPCASDPGGYLAPSPYQVTQNSQKLAAVRLKMDLAGLVIELEKNVADCGLPRVVDGFNEIHRFLLHGEHLRILIEN